MSQVSQSLMAAARTHSHVLVVSQHDVRHIVKVEYRDGAEFSGCAARLGCLEWLHEMHECLYNGVVGGVHVRVKRERTLARAVEGSVSLWCYDPVL